MTTDDTTCSRDSCTHEAGRIVRMNAAGFAHHLLLAAYDKSGRGAGALYTAANPSGTDDRTYHQLTIRAICSVVLEALLTGPEKELDCEAETDRSGLFRALTDLNVVEMMSDVDGYFEADDAKALVPDETLTAATTIATADAAKILKVVDGESD